MKTLRKILFIYIILFTIPVLSAQTHNSVDIDDPVYDLLEIAELKGLINRLSQVRPYTKSKINSLLLEIDRHRNQLTDLEKSVLVGALKTFAPANREVSAQNIYNEGKIHINNDKDALFPMAFGAKFDLEETVDISGKSFSSVNTMEWFVEGDISSFLSYDLRVGGGLNDINIGTYAPYSYSKDGDGYLIAISGGLAGGGLVDGDKDGLAFSLLFKPEISFSSYDERLQINWARHRRDIGNGEGNLTLSGTARPYDGIDIKLRPADWFNFYYSVGSLGNWFAGTVDQADDNNNGIIENNELIFQNMFTTQLFEFMPADWFYFSISNSVVWGRRLELSYMMPFMMPLFAQNLTGDQDNAGIEFSLSFKLPVGVEIYGTLYADEFRFNTALFSDPSVQLGLQGGVRWVIPELPFTIASFQYTFIDPYTYTHYPQDYPFSDSSYYFDASWTNDGENLGYHLPPNSDEFLFRLQSLPYKNLSLYFQYQHIRHGEGNWEEGEMEGDTSAGGIGGGESHAYHASGNKDFLNDGIYEKINIASLGAYYKIDRDYLPFAFEINYSFVHALNHDNIEGNTKLQNVLSLKMHLFPDN